MAWTVGLDRRSGVFALTVALLLGCGDREAGTEGTGTTTGVTSATSTTAGASSDATTDATETADASTSSDASTSTTEAPTTEEPTTTTEAPTTEEPTTSTTDPFTTTGKPSWDFGPSDCQSTIDLVFVMDVSTSMDAILEKLEAEIATVDAAIKAIDVGEPLTPRYGLVVFVDDTAIVNSGMAYTDVADIQAEFNSWYTFAQGNTQVSGLGTNTDWPENTLDALYLAADGFAWGPVDDTLRLIIHTTDDTFGEKPAVQSGVAIQRTYLETVLLLQSREIRVFSFADSDNTGGPFNNQDVSAGFFKPYKGNTEIPLATDGGAFNINQVLSNTLSLSAAINESVEQSLCKQYIPQ
ncbi:MAG: VWA domain-containing protein [Myxococcales bacterium]|nr:VWA domain-containing protein [Myxococcales bacterium]